MELNGTLSKLEKFYSFSKLPRNCSENDRWKNIHVNYITGSEFKDI